MEYRSIYNDQIFSIFIYRRIMHRLKRKNDIISYKLAEDRLPPLSCYEYISSKLLFQPNPLEYDFPLEDRKILLETFIKRKKPKKKAANGVSSSSVLNPTISELRRIGSVHSNTYCFSNTFLSSESVSDTPLRYKHSSLSKNCVS